MAVTKTLRALVAVSTTAAAGASTPTRGRVNLTAALGGFLTIKMENGATPPAAQCVCNVLVAHSSSQPAEASAGLGSAWITIASIGGGTTANGRTEVAIPIDPAVMQLEVEFGGNTSQPVTVEALLSELTSVS